MPGPLCIATQSNRFQMIPWMVTTRIYAKKDVDLISFFEAVLVTDPAHTGGC